jgi:hypothetical protein
MRTNVPALAAVLMAIGVSLNGGCGREQQGRPDLTEEHSHDDHSHAGIHGGQVIELGVEDYHAELAHDEDSHTVAVYILDGTAAANSPIAAESVLVNAVANETPRQFTLLAKPLDDDPAGKTSRFELVDEQLSDGLAGDWDPHAATARINFTVDNTPYFGDIDLHTLAGEHEHADDHSHAEGDHDHADGEDSHGHEHE